MDFQKRLLIAASVSVLIMIGTTVLFPPPEQPTPQNAQLEKTPQSAPSTPKLGKTVPITVKTDTVEAIIDEKTGDLRGLTLLKYDSTSDEKKPFILLDDQANHTYIAQSDLRDANGNSLLKDVSFSAPQKNYQLNGNTVEVRLSAPEQNGLQIDKIYTFQKDSYLINVRFDVKNNGQAIKIAPFYQTVRDASKPEGEGMFMQSYTGPVVYTPEEKFEKVSFSDLDDDFKSGKDSAEYQRKATGGYVGMIQHYFMSAWILQPKGGANACANGCEMSVKKSDETLYSAGVKIAPSDVASGKTTSFNANLFAGPQTTKTLESIAEGLDLAKDYGRVHIFAAPLFWLLKWIHAFLGNWGWSIVLLTIIVKLALFKLNDSAYRSMAKMRSVAPKLEAIKKKFGDDKMGMQQAMMKLYQEEKINPLGGCLPMLVQMPIFIGLYWMIFLSVELRQAPWILWVHDLSRADPFYILPLLMAMTMWYQTTLNPPPSDPVQAKMMKIMPLIFSVMFFFFPAGLVLYYVVNNVLTIVQQRYINGKIEKQAKMGEVLAKK